MLSTCKIFFNLFLSDPGPIIVYPNQSLTHWLTDWRPCWRLNELTFVDGIKFLSNVDIEMKLNMQNMQIMQNMRNMQNIQNTQNMQNMQNTQNMQNMQNM